MIIKTNVILTKTPINNLNNKHISLFCKKILGKNVFRELFSSTDNKRESFNSYQLGLQLYWAPGLRFMRR